MNSHRKTAIIVGVLFIVAIVFFMIGQTIHGPILGSPDYLDTAYPDRMIVMVGMLFEVTGVLAIPLIPVFLFPILKNHNEALALGYASFRLLEAVLLIVVEIGLLSLISVSQGYLDEGGLGASYFQNIGSSIQSVNGWAFFLSVGVVFPLSVLMLNYMLYRTKLIPRWLSVWGLIAGAVLLTGAVLVMFDIFAGIPETGLEVALTILIAVQEMVFAIWLIVKGFNSSAIVPESANTDMNEVELAHMR